MCMGYTSVFYNDRDTIISRFCLFILIIQHRKHVKMHREKVKNEKVKYKHNTYAMH